MSRRFEVKVNQLVERIDALEQELAALDEKMTEMRERIEANKRGPGRPRKDAA